MQNHQELKIGKYEFATLDDMNLAILRLEDTNKYRIELGFTEITMDEYVELGFNSIPCKLYKLKDNINHPSHYKQILGHESIDVMKDIVKDLPGVQAALVFNILKYVTRYPYKNGAEDIKKFLKYGEWLLAEVEKSSCPEK